MALCLVEVMKARWLLIGLCKNPCAESQNATALFRVTFFLGGGRSNNKVRRVNFLDAILNFRKGGSKFPYVTLHLSVLEL